MRLFVLAAAFCLCSANTFATDYDCGEIPGTVTCSLSADGKSMTVTGSGAIKGYENNENRPWLKTVESVVMDDTITAVGQRAFKGATKLTSVVMPGVVTIENSAFNATKLVTVDLPNVETVGQSAFENVSTLKSVNIPKATSIGLQAFYQTTSLETINMPEVKSVGEKAFYKATSLTSVDLPNAEVIEGQAFQMATSLTTVSIPSATEIKYDAFQGDKNLTIVDATSVETIGNRAFKDCSGLESLDLPSLITLAKDVFINDVGLTEIYAPNLQVIGNAAFYHTGLTSVDLPSLVEISGSAFENSSNLAYVSFPENVVITGGRQFNGTQISLLTYYLEDGSKIYGVCPGYIMSGKGCVSSCGTDYRPDNGKCVPNPCDGDKVLYGDECMDEYPFAKKHYTPAEAGRWLKAQDNVVTLTFKK